MVCLGNICRSPLAHGILKDMAQKSNLTIEVDSAGTGSWHTGEPPDIRSIEIANTHGINIKKQRARQFSTDDFIYFDIIYVMDTSNHIDLINLAKDNYHKQKVKLILNEIAPGQNRSVPDPYFGGKDGFENVFSMLEHACSLIIHKLNDD